MIKHAFFTHALWQELARRGYTREETTAEDGTPMDVIRRPDGSVALVARRKERETDA